MLGLTPHKKNDFMQCMKFGVEWKHEFPPLIATGSQKNISPDELTSTLTQTLGRILFNKQVVRINPTHEFIHLFGGVGLNIFLMDWFPMNRKTHTYQVKGKAEKEKTCKNGKNS